MQKNQIVSRSEWLIRRKELLAQERQLTHLRDELTEKRRQLPWVEVDKPYVFDGPNGRETLAELFEGRHQLVVYHFMFGPDAEVGCKSCSFWADGFDGIIPHLNQRDVTFAVISRAPLAKLQAFEKRLGWRFKWVSSLNSDFNHDFGVSFTPEEIARGEAEYNYGPFKPVDSERHGLSVFYKDGDRVFHTYSCFARGVDAMNPAYQYLDIVPKGRDENGHPMAWVRYRDRYDAR